MYFIKKILISIICILYLYKYKLKNIFCKNKSIIFNGYKFNNIKQQGYINIIINNIYINKKSLIL